MKISKNSLVLTAAFAGLLGGTMTRLNAAPASGSSNPTVSSQAGQLSTTLNDDKDTHACQGKNSCKGKGGCKASDNGCKAKNSCKGKGGCATDGSKKQ
jgi:hypothetical protein